MAGRSGRGVSGAIGVALLALLAAPARAHPEGCPSRFDQFTTGLPEACVFVGRASSDCADDTVALFAGDGSALVVSLSSPANAAPFFIPAQTLSATEGKLVLWKPDLELARAPSVGSVRLEQDGRRLVVRLDRPLTSNRGCTVREFVGTFAGMVQAGDAPSAAPQSIAAVAR